MNFVQILNDEQVHRLMTFYRDYQADSANESVLFFAKTPYITVTIYKSNKVMFQGQDAAKEYDMWNVLLGFEEVKQPEKVVETTDYYTISIGSDEVGTGDFFGPIVVCAVYVSKDILPYLQGLGINDSKKLTDEVIRKLGVELKDKVVYSLLTLHNEKYNDINQVGFNMNKIKAYLHNKAILNLHQKLLVKPKVIVDQFVEPALYFRYLQQETTVFKDIYFTTKAESKFASVAVASILARYAFLQHFDILSKESGYTLPKGASHAVDEVAACIIKEKGEGFLRQIAKLNFKTLEKAKELVK